MLSEQEYLDKWNQNEYYSKVCLVRVTNQCNETCQHCCFRSGPKVSGQMTIDMCQAINSWAPDYVVFNIMGGEFSILDNYPDILLALSSKRSDVTLTTNGAWARSVKETNKFFNSIHMLKKSGCGHIDLAVSTDKWHVPLCHEAVKILEQRPIDANWYAIGGGEIDDLTPVGRAWDNKLIPQGPVQCFCGTAPSLIITEDGMIHKCPFAYFPWKHFSETTWKDAIKYVWGWRATKLSNGMTCVGCMQSLDTVQCSLSIQNK